MVDESRVIPIPTFFIGHNIQSSDELLKNLDSVTYSYGTAENVKRRQLNEEQKEFFKKAINSSSEQDINKHPAFDIFPLLTPGETNFVFAYSYGHLQEIQTLFENTLVKDLSEAN